MHRNLLTVTRLTPAPATPVELARKYWVNDSHRAHKKAATAFALGTGELSAMSHAKALQRHSAAAFGFIA
jgi:hypothetical protein